MAIAPVDLIRLALRDAGVNGVGQAPSAEDNNDAFTHLNMMLAQWSRKRWLVYHLLDVVLVSTGAQSYTIGAGGAFNTPRPDRIEAAFVRYLATTPNADWPVTILESREDYNNVIVKSIGNVPYYVYYDAAYPLGTVYWYPVADAGTYQLHLTLKQELSAFPDLVTAINFPPEYQEALLYNLAIRLRFSYQMEPDRALESMAASALATIRASNAQIPRLAMPNGLGGKSRFNIYTGS